MRGNRCSGLQRSRGLHLSTSKSTYAAAFDLVGGALCDALLLLGSDEDDSSLLLPWKCQCGRQKVR
jgi:hypothetical protein